MTTGLAAAGWRARPRPARRDLALLPILALAAWGRLAHLERTGFVLDQAGIYAMARDAVARRALPATGIISSIQTFNAPAVIYAYLPFALLPDPAIGAWATALANVLAVALAYTFARRYLGYVAAVVGAALFAVAAWPVFYSRTIWQQNLLPPLVMALVLLVAAGLVGSKARWLAWALPLWALMVQLHPTTAPLGGLLAAGWLLAPRTVRRRDVLLGAAVTALLFVPSLLWEVSSHFYDVHAFLQYGRGRSVTDLTTLREFLRIADLPNWLPWQGTFAGRALFTLDWALVVAGAALVAWRLVAEARGAWRGRAVSLAPRSWSAGIGAALAWAQAPARARWRIDALLLLWPGLVLASQLRHLSDVQLFYLIPTLPVQFLLVGALAEAAWRGWRAFSPLPRGEGGQGVGSVGMRAALAGALLVGLTLEGAAQLAASPGQYPQLDVNPLAAELAGLRQARAIIARDHLALAVLDPDFFTRDSVRYLLANGDPLGVAAQIIEPDECLTLDSAGGGAALYLFSGPTSYVEQVARAVAGGNDLFAGGAAAAYFRAYEVAPDTLLASLPSATPAGGVSPDAHFGHEAALERVAYDPPALSAPELAAVADFSAPFATAPFAT
ncbi:MAG TPA: glycosyltransferase family 39 protein, partial [Ktedonobacterales bacterium]|nr:glycosyltransferase family 39 protein [Ktedonobacterales bacterium]